MPLTPEDRTRVLKILDYLRSNEIVLNHAVNLLLGEIEKDTAADVLSLLPPQVYDAIRDVTDGMPRTEEQWANWIDIGIRCAEYDPNIRPEELEKGFQDSERQTRRAIEALREYFALHPS